MTNHTRRTPPAEAPYLARTAATDRDQRWVHRSPEAMLDTFPWFRGEAFGRIVEDLVALAPEPVVAEGFRLLPALVAPLLDHRRRAVWLLPTPDFRRHAFAHRSTTAQIVGHTNDPERARVNLLERDRLFTERLRVETASLALPVITVDGSATEDELVDRVADALARG